MTYDVNLIYNETYFSWQIMVLIEPHSNSRQNHVTFFVVFYSMVRIAIQEEPFHDSFIWLILDSIGNIGLGVGKSRYQVYLTDN